MIKTNLHPYVSDWRTFEAGFDSTPINGLEARSSFYFNSLILGSEVGNSFKNKYKFYMGPKKEDLLKAYNDADKNEFKESGLKLEVAVPGNFPWGLIAGVLEIPMKFFFNFTGKPSIFTSPRVGWFVVYIISFASIWG